MKRFLTYGILLLIAFSIYKQGGLLGMMKKTDPQTRVVTKTKLAQKYLAERNGSEYTKAMNDLVSIKDDDTYSNMEKMWAEAGVFINEITRSNMYIYDKNPNIDKENPTIKVSYQYCLAEYARVMSGDTYDAVYNSLITLKSFGSEFIKVEKSITGRGRGQ